MLNPVIQTHVSISSQGSTAIHTKWERIEVSWGVRVLCRSQQSVPVRFCVLSRKYSWLLERFVFDTQNLA